MFFRRLQSLFEALIVFSAAFVFFELLAQFSFAVKYLETLSSTLSAYSLWLGLCFFISYFAWRWKKNSSLALSDAARSVEEQSSAFRNDLSQKAELRSAASFLDSFDPSSSLELQKAHISRVEKSLRNYAIEILPKAPFWVLMAIGLASLITSLELERSIQKTLPSRVVAWSPGTFEYKMPFEGSEWQPKSGSLSAVAGSEIRFEAPDHGALQTYLFIKQQGEEWSYSKCKERCEFSLEKSGRYAVGNMLYRSAKLPLIAIPNEKPRAVLFVKSGEDLVPSASLRIKEQAEVQFELLATDDLVLKKASLIHRFEDNEEVLFSKNLDSDSFKATYDLRISDWEGGSHEVFLRVWDHAEKVDSSPVSISFADEEFLREQRVRNLRALINDWLHVLADLLESRADQQIAASLETRIQAIQYPENLNEGLMAVFSQELKSLGEEIVDRLIIREEIRSLPSLVSRVEKQILYGLSLLFQEKTGDLQASTDNVRNSQASLEQMLEKLKSGKGELDAQELQKTFENLLGQLSELQKKIRELPKGPSDDLINREALQEQASQSQQLEDRISEIQDLLSQGQDEQAVKELESLVNQLSILTKEIDRSMDQWEQNFAQGAMQGSEEFQNDLQKLSERQEELAEETKEAEEKLRDLERRELGQLQSEDAKELEELKEKLESLEEEQDGLKSEFEKISQDFSEQLEGSEWESVFRSSEMKKMEEEISNRMTRSSEEIRDQRLKNAETLQRETVDLLNKAGEQQQQMRQQVQKMAEQQRMAASERRQSGRVEIVEESGKGERERRRKIMNSLRQEVPEEYQGSHEQYFQELLQR